MAAIASQDGSQNVKTHPYLVALLRWCVCIWSTATVVLHRLLTNRLPPLPAIKPAIKPRAASSDHLHPEPKVECVVLHQPDRHGLDVIFVHGLYGSLANTWRQGEWRSKHPRELNKIPLIKSQHTCNCHTFEEYNEITNKNTNDKEFTVTKIEDFMTENFYNESLKEQVEIVDYETQAMFVRDLFNEKKDIDECSCDDRRDKHENCQCKDVKQCEVGCGCICDDCYSACWPKDWIKADYPEARVISVNYTSDPHLWRPLWIKENKRLQLHERAEQMTQQLLDLGVGENPIIWVGHSKGGLFIKQIYCEAYESYLKHMNASTNKNTAEYNKDNELNHIKDTDSNIEQTDNITDGFIEHCDSNIDDIDTDVNTSVPNHENMFVLESDDDVIISSNNEEDKRRSTLWRNSCGFMFYSVPHRGSPLADITTPLTARSVELTEICKDCPLVLSLQERWLRATAPAHPHVRSLVETCRTLMSVLWLRIVSVHSADAGVGTLCGVSVDHREICKPSSRQCLLYTELMDLMRSALYRCRCH